MSDSEQKIYTCPMHPEIEQERPGMCPECGMALVPNKSRPHRGRGSQISQAKSGHAGHSTRMFLKKFWVRLVLTVPVIFLHFRGDGGYWGYLGLMLGSAV